MYDMRDERQVTVDTTRSGWLQRFRMGHDADIQRPATFFEDFLGTVLMNADTRAEGTLFYVMTRKDRSGGTSEIDPRPTSFAASKVLNYPSNAPKQEPLFGFNVNANLKNNIVGLTKVERYFKDKPLALSVRDSLSFKFFQYSRDFIFGGFKFVDTVVRWPVIASSAVQLFFERAGWAMRNNQTPYLRWPIRGLGFVASGVGAVGAVVTPVLKVLVEFVRTPLAVAGATVGLVFGLGTAIFSRRNDAFDSMGKCIMQGLIDGIRPFAPNMADNITFYVDGLYKDARAPIPWGTIAGVVVGLALVTTLSVVTFGGFAGLAAVLPVALHALGIGGIAGSTYLAPLAAVLGKALVAMNIAVTPHLVAFVAATGLIGACAKAGSFIGDGLNALINDSKRVFTDVKNAWNRFWEARLRAQILAAPNLQDANAVGVQMHQLTGAPASLQQQFQGAMHTLSNVSQQVILTPAPAPAPAAVNPINPVATSTDVSTVAASATPPLKHSKSMGNLSQGDAGPTTARNREERAAINSLSKSQSYSNLSPAQLKVEQELVQLTLARKKSNASSNASDSPPPSPPPSPKGPGKK